MTSKTKYSLSTLLLVWLLIFTRCSLEGTQSQTDATTTTTTPTTTYETTITSEPGVTEETEETIFRETHMYEDLRGRYYGRLFIPELDISVALYNTYEQYVTDREDAANIFGDGETYYVIADHSNQEFSKLFGVTIGTRGYVKNKFMQTIEFECTSVFHGYNAGYSITDTYGNNVMGLDDYLIYTCNRNGGVFISLWDIK